MYDTRHRPVRKFYEELNTIKWDFKEWNAIIENPLQSTAISYPESRKI